MENDQDINGSTPEDILGTISYAQQSESLRTADPQGAVVEYLEKLPPRERQVLTWRYGLADNKTLTLEEIGTKLQLTRERIRQIEKDGLIKLGQIVAPENYRKIFDLIYQFIEDRGNVAGEKQILTSILAERPSEVANKALLFVLRSREQFRLLKESPKYHQSWYLTGLDLDQLDNLNDQAGKILLDKKKSIPAADLISELRPRLGGTELEALTNEAIESYLTVSKKIGRNPYGEFGLAEWTDIKPHDVGDKAFLVLSHLGKPEHYSKITELVNKRGFDIRTAHKESVHNELIKDKRFVLVGRGIYGLAEWGYRPGVVADIISQLITDADHPLSKEEIVSGVLKQRMVKRNTIIVGLSNKNKFRKTADNKYSNA